MIDRTEEFAVVRAIREHIKGRNKHCSPATVADYNEKFARMRRTGFRPEHAKCPQTFQAYRAALIWNTLQSGKAALRARDKSAYGSAEWSVSMNRLRTVLQVLEQYITSDPSTLSPSPVSARQPSSRTSAKRSKKKILPILCKEPGWRPKVFLNIPLPYRDALAVCAVAGVRPSEIQHGVEVSRQGCNLVVKIFGAKVTSTSGQPTRSLTLAICSEEGVHLFERAENMPIYVSVNAQSFCAAVERAGRKALPHLTQMISPYVYRHLFCSSLKAEGRSKDSIAACLGHATTKSQSAYGRYAHGRIAASGLISVCAAIAVRRNHRDLASVRPRRGHPAPGLRPSFG